MAVFVSRAVNPLNYVQRASDFAVGESVYLSENGIPVEYIVVHQGNPDAALYDASCDGMWLLRRDIYESRQWHSSNVNDYANSTIHSYLNSTCLALFDNATRSAIKSAKIPYVNGTGSSAVASGANGLTAQIFLLSGYEVGFTTSVNPYFPVDGAKLDYFVSGNDAAAQAKRIAYLNGTADIWWFRSPDARNSTSAWVAIADGNYGAGYRATNAYGVRPALILSSTALFDPTTKELKEAGLTHAASVV